MNAPPTFSRWRRFRILMNVSLSSLLAPILGGLLIYLCYRPEFRRRIDLTPAGVFSLSDRTLKILEGLDRDVDVFASFRPGDFNRSGNMVAGLRRVMQAIAQHTADLLREYELRGRGKVHLHLFDPNNSSHLSRLDDLQRLLGRPAQNLVFVTDGMRRRTLELTDLAEFDSGAELSGGQRPARLHAFKDEEAISAAILSVTEDQPIRVGVLTGHGEKRFDAGSVDAAGRAGLSSFFASLSAQNFDLGALTADQLGPAPPDVLAILAPLRAIPDDDLAAIVRFADAGGRLFVMLDPESSQSLDTPILDRLLGLERLHHTVCLETRVAQWTRDPNQFETGLYTQHAIVEPLLRRRLDTFWLGACALRALDRRQKEVGTIELLVFTPPESWLNIAEPSAPTKFVYDPAREQRSSFRLAFAVERNAGARSVVIADSDLLDNLSIAQAAGNRDFGLNCFEWLARREKLISIAPVPYRETRVDLNPAEASTVFFYVIVAIPALALVLAVTVFWNRRR